MQGAAAASNAKAKMHGIYYTPFAQLEPTSARRGAAASDGTTELNVCTYLCRRCSIGSLLLIVRCSPHLIHPGIIVALPGDPPRQVRYIEPYRRGAGKL